MDKLPFVEIKELNKSISSCDSYQDIFSIVDLDGSLSIGEKRDLEEYSSPVRMNALLVALILDGSADIKIDYTTYKIEQNGFLTITPTHIIQAASVSKDFKAKMLVVDRSFLEECRPEFRSPSMNNYMQIRKNPYTVFAPEETFHLEMCFEQLREKINNQSHFFHKEVLQNSFIAFLLEMANILMGKKDGLVAVPTLSRKEELLNQFLQLLLVHCKEQHGVTFYAEKMFITPQYLSLILKELTGKSANKWIDDALMVEAKILLKMPQTTVQQVADELNFSDQSTFGKFFKKHMGMSPMEYRKNS
ncbi:MAG: helix-turn-helix transcriptional regulator [Tannerellaceae bacterium]|nr:helix-turn-helix transcriptional regulator [Tannerellaceae bacterium]